MATTTKVIVQIHQMTTEVAIDADLQLREIGFISNTNVIRFNENDGTKHNVWMQDSSAPVFDNGLTLSSTLDVGNILTIDTAAQAINPRLVFDHDNLSNDDYIEVDRTTGTMNIRVNGVLSQTISNTGATAFAQMITANGGLTLGAGDDLIGSSTSDINMNSGKFLVSGATGSAHIKEGTSGATASTVADALVIENSANTGMSIITPDASSSIIYLGSASGNNDGELSWKYGAAGADKRLRLNTNVTGGVIEIGTDANVTAIDIDSSQIATFSAGVTLAAGADLILSSTSELIIGGTQDYTFTSRGNVLTLQSQTAATTSRLEMSSSDGDGTDDVKHFIIGVGNPASMVNTEILEVGYEATGTKFQIATSQAGSGTVRTLELLTEGNTNQLLLNIDGSNTMSGALGVTGLITASAGVTLAAGANLILSSTSDINLDNNFNVSSSGVVKWGSNYTTANAGILTWDTNEVMVGSFDSGSGLTLLVENNDAVIFAPTTMIGTFQGGITLAAGADLILSSTSDINGTAFDVDGATGNTIIGGTLGVTGVLSTTAQATIGTWLSVGGAIVRDVDNSALELYGGTGTGDARIRVYSSGHGSANLIDFYQSATKKFSIEPDGDVEVHLPTTEKFEIYDGAGTVFVVNASANTIKLGNAGISYGFEFLNSGQCIFGGQTIHNNGLRMDDNDKAQFGTGDDGAVYHNGTNFIIDNTQTGDTVLQTTSGSIISNANAGYEVQLQVNSVEVAAISAAGLDVTGTLDASGIVTLANLDANRAVFTNASKELDTTPPVLSFTATLTGVDSSVTASGEYQILGQWCHLLIYAMNGTSNTTGCSITGLPAVLETPTQHYFLGHGEDNTGNIAVSASIATGVSPAIILYPNATWTSASGWTASGTKGIKSLEFMFRIA